MQLKRLIMCKLPKEWIDVHPKDKNTTWEKANLERFQKLAFSHGWKRYYMMVLRFSSVPPT